MSEATQSKVKDFEDNDQTFGTNSGNGADDNHSPILPDADHAAEGNGGGVKTLDNHSPILPEDDCNGSADDGDVTTLDNHSPIAPPKATRQKNDEDKGE